MIPLPIDSSLPEIVDRVRAARSLVLVAPPGAGKTTRVPVALARAGLLAADHPALVLLQPRRVAARACAERIAEENGWTLGEEVGYQVRFERRVGPRTRIRVATEGILTRQLVAGMRTAGPSPGGRRRSAGSIMPRRSGQWPRNGPAAGNTRSRP
jgi:ATP-dependent helicase HrpB